MRLTWLSMHIRRLALALLLLAPLAAAPAVSMRAAAGGRVAGAHEQSPVFQRARARYLPAVVRVETWRGGSLHSIGTGTFISATGELLTNQHVMRTYLEDPKSVEVRFVFANGKTVRKFEIRKCNLRYSVDLCYLRVDVFPDANFTLRGAPVKPNDVVYLMGNPGGRPFHTVEAHYLGTHSYDNREDIELCGGVEPGMSGGPVFTADGRLAGLATYRTTTRAPGSSDAPQVRYFGMSARHIQRFLDGK